MEWFSGEPCNWISEQTTASDIEALTSFLTEQGTFRFPALENGLFSAAAGEGADFEASGYLNVWLRDNVHIAWAHWAVTGSSEKAARCVSSLLTFYQRHRHRFVDIIEGRLGSADPMNRPHIRFNGLYLEELPEKWAHAQNDALGYLLWLACRLANEGAIPVDTVLINYCTLLIPYWKTIRVWEDEDSGHWEENRKISASSIGCAAAGLRELERLMISRDDLRTMSSGTYRLALQEVAELLNHCRSALQQILPAECTQADPSKNRPVDAALLFLIYPLDVVGDVNTENRILTNVISELQGPIGIRRYSGDSYWCADYRSLLSAETRTADFSDNLQARDQLLKPGMEAQWCIFDPIISCIYGTRYLKEHRHDDLQQQRHALARSLGQLTTCKDRFPPYRCPESWFCENNAWIPNDITPLLWTQGNLWQALQLMKTTLQLPPKEKA